MTVYAITDTKKGRTGIAPTYLQTTPIFKRKSYYHPGLDWSLVAKSITSPEMFRYSTAASCTCALLAVHAHC